MDNENNTKKGIPQELPEELLADVGGGGRYSGKGYKPLGNIYGRCEKYVYRKAEDGWENENPDDCLRCRYFRVEMGAYNDYTPYCTYPDDWTFQYEY